VGTTRLVKYAEMSHSGDVRTKERDALPILVVKQRGQKIDDVTTMDENVAVGVGRGDEGGSDISRLDGFWDTICGPRQQSV
jgi:hypothetical protein